VGFQHERLGPRLVEAARSGERYRDAHMFLGGTGAVGGTALLQMLSMYEEMFAISPPQPDDVPVLVATGTTADEIQAFTRRLFRFVESRHGSDHLPERVRSGFLTSSGVFVALERFEVSAVPGLRQIAQTPLDDRRRVTGEFLQSIGTGLDDDPQQVDDAIAKTVASARPFGEFLLRYVRTHLADRGIAGFRSVVMGIPVPSLVAYHQDELNLATQHVDGFGRERLEALKLRFVEAIRDDLVDVKQHLADEVLIAHTTGVGGMYDEDPDDRSAPPRIRMGFSHAALDTRLAEKAHFAQELTEKYSEAGLKVLITAAAIGIDEVRVRDEIPLHRGIRRLLFEADREVFPGSKESQPAESRASRAAGRPLPARQVVRVAKPISVPWDDPPAAEATFERGEPVVPAYAIRSGENGFFSVANADALYRVMHVASASELGLMLATVGLLGEDRLKPWFPGGVCYYVETENTRQVAVFLAQPALRQSQLSGLEPMALQDLGSAKHQAELHTLALLILLHRLRTLDVDAIDPYVDLERFDPRQFFLAQSRPLTFEEVAAWELGALEADLVALVSADSPEDLLRLTPPRKHTLFPKRQRALLEVLNEVLRGVRLVTSLGTPILYDRDGRTWLRCGYYVAPLDLLVTDESSVASHLRQRAAEAGQDLELLRDYHVAVGGFVDLRPHAIVCTARSEAELAGRVARFDDEEALRRHLFTLEPYSFFATSGLLAVLYRLRALWFELREAMLELGTLHEWRWHMPQDRLGHTVLVPGVVEAFRLVAEGLEKTTGTERLAGQWGYERKPPPDRRGAIPGVSNGA
jgi:hypothetical protein